MLESPELEVIRERLRLKLVGRRIGEARLYQQAALRAVDATMPQLKDSHVRSIERVGQHLIFSTDTGLLLDIDFTRGGSIEMARPDRPVPPGLVFSLAGEEISTLCVTDHRFPSRAALFLVRDRKQLPHLAELGLDPFSPDFTMDRFRRVLARRNRPARHVLTDRRHICGLGSACADEVLFEARLSPYRTTGDIKPEESIRLYMAVKKTLSGAVVHYKNLPADELPDGRQRDFLRVHHREGQSCPVCGSTVRLVRDGRIASRYCPTCQTGGEILVDRGLPSQPERHA